MANSTKRARRMVCADHRGHIFSSKAERARAYKLSYQAVEYRLKKGWTLEEALTKPAQTTIWNYEDHEGDVYETVHDMTEKYHIKQSTFYTRMSKGWSMEEALTTPVRDMNEHKYMDHKGRPFNSFPEMARAYGINDQTLTARLARGWTLEKALTLPLRPIKGKACKDHLGNEYSRMKEMADAYNIKRNTLDRRLDAGWTLEEALTTPTGARHNEGPCKACKDHLGNEYGSMKEMANAHNIGYMTLYYRLKKGWDVEEALTTPVGARSKKACEDHLGNEYESISEMARAYSVNVMTLESRLLSGWSLEEALTHEKYKKRNKINTVPEEQQDDPAKEEANTEKDVAEAVDENVTETVTVDVAETAKEEHVSAPEPELKAETAGSKSEKPFFRFVTSLRKLFRKEKTSEAEVA